jgi:head-tail adaptor
MRAGELRHRVDVLRPPTSLDDRGQPRGQEEVVLRQVPCGIETLNGREAEQARTNYAEATHRVRMYGDPSKPIKTKDYLQFGTRRLEIGFIDDELQNGIKLTLICGERT